MNYWNEYGITLWENGFTVVPIIPPDSPRPKAGKRPAFEDWQKIENTRGQINGFVKKYASSGIGILTKHTPAVDIDVYDKDGVKHMMAIVEKKIGAGPVRVVAAGPGVRGGRAGGLRRHGSGSPPMRTTRSACCCSGCR